MSRILYPICIRTVVLEIMDPVSNNPNLSSKQRLRWTHELHERFVDAVAQLGGPDRKFLTLVMFAYSNMVCVIL